MKHIIISIVALSLLAGCATTGKYEKKLASWVGVPEATLVQNWGPPGSVYPLPEGGKMLTYQWNGGSQTTVMPGAFGGAVASTNTAYCRTTFSISPEGMVNNWRWDGNACRAD